MNVFELMAKISLDTSGYTKSLDTAKKAAGTVAKVGVAAFEAVGKAAVGASVKLVKETANAVKVGMNFDASMSQVAATMGKTVDEIQDLREFAKEMGRTTSFSASQAADALNYMALAGYSSETSMKMLPNVLNLAAAGGIDLAYASDMITDSQSALGLSLEQTSNLVDQMAKAASKTNTSVAQLGEAILTVGGTAKTMKGGTVELSTALGILADNGIKGAEGGTALRNILMSMSSDKFKNVFGELGVSAYDANGKMRDMNDILSEMNQVMSSMTDEKKTKIISKAFNKYDLKAVNALLGTTSQRWNEVSDAIENSAGSSAKMADTQLDNLSGNITKFKSALEGAQIVISDKLSPTLSEFVKFGTEGLSKITDAFSKNGFEGATEAFNDVLGDALKTISKIVPKVIKMIVTILPQIGKALIENINAVVPYIPEMIKTLVDAAAKLLPDLTEIAIQIVKQLSVAIVDALPVLVEALPEIIKALANGIVDMINALPDILTMMESVIDTVCDTLIDLIPTLVEAALMVMEKVIEYMMNPENTIKLVEMAAKLIIAVAGGLLAAVPNLLAGIGKIITSCINNILSANWGKLGQDMINSITGALQNASGKLMEWWDGWSKKIGETAVAAWNGVVSTWSKVGEFFAGIWTSIKNTFSGVATWFKDIFSNAWGSIKSVFAPAGATFQKIGETAVAAWNGVVDTWSKVGGFFSGIWTSIKNTFSGVATWFKDIFTKAWEGIKSIFAPVGTTFQNIGNSILNGLKSVVNGLIGGINNIINIPFEGLNAALRGIKGINIAGVKPFDWISEITVPQIPYLAKGGIVEKPTQAIIGEAGAEAIVPLENNTQWIDKLAEKIGKKGNSYYFTVNFDGTINNRNDLESLADDLMYIMQEKIERQGAVYG